MVVPPGHPTDFKVTASVLYGTKIVLQFSWRPPVTGDPADTYWIKCNKSLAGDNSISQLTIRITLPTLHLRANTNGKPYTSYHCHSYASNGVGDGPFSRTDSISPIPIGKHFCVSIFMMLTLKCLLCYLLVN